MSDVGLLLSERLRWEPDSRFLSGGLSHTATCEFEREMRREKENWMIWGVHCAVPERLRVAPQFFFR